MKVLGVDPGKRAGWALWSDDTRGGRLVQSGVVNGDSAAAVYNFLMTMQVTHLVVEEQMHRVAERMGHKSLGTLIRRMHIWTVCAELNFIPFETVNPKTWQAFFHLPLREGGPQFKAVIQNLARRWAPNVQPDEADAVCIGKRAVMLANPQGGSL